MNDCITTFFAGLVTVAIVVTCVLFTDDGGGSATELGSPVISPGEQMLVCRKKGFIIEYSSDDIKLYESMHGVPEVSGEVRTVASEMRGHLSYSTYDYRSLLLTPGSVVTVNSSTSGSYYSSHATVVIKGTEEMERFLNDKSYTAVYRHLGLNNVYTIEATEYAEYFVVVDAGSSSMEYTLILNGTLPTFSIENLTEPEQCTAAAAGLCRLNSENNPEYCVVLDYNVSATYAGVEVTIVDANEDSGISTVVIVIIVMGAVVFIVVVAVIVFFVVKTTKESDAGTANDVTTSLTSQQQQQYQQYQQPSEVSMESEAGGVCASPSYVPSSIGPYSAPQPSAPLPTYSTVYGSTNPSTQVFEPAYSSSYPTAPPPQPPS